jgi:replicative DNA helicase
MMPSAPDAEAGLLGHYLEGGLDAFHAWPASQDYFTDAQRRAVFLAMMSLAERAEAIEPVTVTAELRRQDQGVRPDFVMDLVDHAAVSGGLVLGILRECATRRAMARAGEHLRAAAQDGQQVPAEAVEKILAGLARQTASLGRLEAAPEATSLEAAWLDALTKGEDPTRPRIQTGLVDLDNISPGELPRGEVTIAGARTGVGKTALVVQIATHNAARGLHVLVCSAEMTTSQLLARQKASATGIPLERILRGRLTAADLARLRGQRLTSVRLYDKAGMTTADVRALVARFSVTARPLDLVVVDHLHHLSDPFDRGESRYGQIGRMVAALKDTAKLHGCAMLVAAQLNRQAADREPTLADLRDAGTIEEFASVVLLLHRSDDAPTTCQVFIAKHRNGPTGKVSLYFDGPCLRFRDGERREVAA